MIRPQPLRFRINRRKTVSVTPAMGARTVAGAISTVPRRTLAGTGTSVACSGREFAGLSQYLRTMNSCDGAAGVPARRTGETPVPPPTLTYSSLRGQ